MDTDLLCDENQHPTATESNPNTKIKASTLGLPAGSTGVRLRDAGNVAEYPPRYSSYLQPLEPNPRLPGHANIMEFPVSPLSVIQSPNSRLFAPSTSTPMSLSPILPFSPVFSMLRSNANRGPFHLLDSSSSFGCGPDCFSPMSFPRTPMSSHHPFPGVTSISNSNSSCYSSDSVGDLLGSPFSSSTIPSGSTTPSKFCNTHTAMSTDTLDAFKDLELSKSDGIFSGGTRLHMAGPSSICSSAMTTTSLGHTRWTHEAQFKWTTQMGPPPSITVLPDAPATPIHLSEPPHIKSEPFDMQPQTPPQFDVQQHCFISAAPSKYPILTTADDNSTAAKYVANDDFLPRNANGFTLFCNDIQMHMQADLSKNPNHEITRVLAQKWKMLSSQQKQYYINASIEQRRATSTPNLIASASSDAVNRSSDSNTKERPQTSPPVFSSKRAASSNPGSSGKGKRKSSSQNSTTSKSATPTDSHHPKKKLPNPMTSLPPALLSATTSKLSNVNRTPDGQRIRRPMNAFILFSNDMRPRLAEENPTMPNKDISKLIGDKWKQMSENEKQPYLDKAAAIREKFNKEYPDFKYSNYPKALRTYLKLNARQISVLFQQQLQQQQQQQGGQSTGSSPTIAPDGAAPAKKRKLENGQSVDSEYEDVVLRLVVELVNQQKLTPDDYRTVADFVVRHDPKILAIHNECVLNSKECTIDYFCARIRDLVICARQQGPSQASLPSNPSSTSFSGAPTS